MILAVLFACTGPATETDTDDTDVVDTDADEQAFVTVLYSDFATEAPLANVSVTSGATTLTTDSTGTVSFEVAHDSDFELVASLDGYTTSHLFGHIDDRLIANYTTNLVTTELRDSLLGAFDTESDPARGMVVVTAEVSGEATDVSGLTGAIIDLDVAYDLALAADPSAEFGLSAGNTVAADSQGFVVFANTAVGAANATVTHPDGYGCAVSPGDEASLQFTVYANEISAIIYSCIQF
jgi:hypothetical protein